MLQNRVLSIFVHSFLWNLVVYLLQSQTCPVMHQRQRSIPPPRRGWRAAPGSRTLGQTFLKAPLFWHQPLLFLNLDKKAGGGRGARIVMQIGWKPRVFSLGFFSSFTSYANISTLSYSFYCTCRGIWVSCSLVNPAESCLNLKGCFNKIYILPAPPCLWWLITVPFRLRSETTVATFSLNPLVPPPHPLFLPSAPPPLALSSFCPPTPWRHTLLALFSIQNILERGAARAVKALLP